jgi:hypothetical protein
MSLLLFGTGAIAVIAGIAMIAFGIPVSEFSFGNTMIMAGTTAVVGGLIVIGLGAAVGQLQRIVESLNGRAPTRPGRPLEFLEAGAARTAAPPARIPFPARPKAEPTKTEPNKSEPIAEALAEPHREETGFNEPFAPELYPEVPPPPAPPPFASDTFNEPPPETFAPTLPNPDEPPVTVEDEVSLSPKHPTIPPPPGPPPFEERARHMPPPPWEEPLSEPEEQAGDEADRGIGWHAPTPPKAEIPPPPPERPRTTFFDTMWPAEPKAPSKPPEREQAFAPTFEPPPAPPPEPVEMAEQEEPEPPKPEPRAVAILKSGVVDGMGYTLYVDGSIEAELPNGTLRFASINELRSHLEKTS